MQLYRSLTYLPKRNYAVTIGNYDGVHCGHQAILEKLNSVAQTMSLPTLVMTFFPGPEEYFQKQHAKPRLSTLSDRFFALRQCGIDVMLALPFNQYLAETTAEIFVEEVLVQRVNTKYLLIGDDFSFGNQRKGNITFLEQQKALYGYSVEQYATVFCDGERISSSRVRQCLMDGNLAMANQLLGRIFSISGKVCHGDKRGREWGFPTLNIPIKRKLPIVGIFAVKVQLDSGVKKLGVASLGKRPNIDDNVFLEVHLFDFNGALYGRRVCVEFFEKIRAVRKFDSTEILKQQIADDCVQAKSILKKYS